MLENAFYLIALAILLGAWAISPWLFGAVAAVIIAAQLYHKYRYGYFAGDEHLDSNVPIDWRQNFRNARPWLLIWGSMFIGLPIVLYLLRFL